MAERILRSNQHPTGDEFPTAGPAIVAVARADGAAWPEDHSVVAEFKYEDKWIPDHDNALNRDGYMRIETPLGTRGRLRVSAAGYQAWWQSSIYKVQI